jgi:hypothetical protein
VALLYQDGDLRLGLFDAASWSPAGDHPAISPSDSPIGIAPGAGLGDSGVGYAGRGYGVLYQRIADDGLEADILFAVLGPDGSPWLAPKRVGARLPRGAVRGSVAWSGSHYLVAAARHPDEPGMDVYRYVPASGDLVDDSALEHVWGVHAPAGNGAAWPHLSRAEGGAWLAIERHSNYDRDVATTVTRLNTRGEQVLEERPLSASGSARLVDLDGQLAAVSWGASDGTPGPASLAVELFDADLSPRGEPVLIEHGWPEWGPNAAVAIDGGVAFVAVPLETHPNEVLMTTLRCVP